MNLSYTGEIEKKLRRRWGFEVKIKSGSDRKKRKLRKN